MQGGDRLLQFPDAHLAPVGVRRIAAFGNIVIHRIIAPVITEFRFRLIYRTIVIHRQQLNVGHAQPFEIIQARRMHTVMMQSGTFPAQGRKFTPVGFREAAGFVPGKILHMQLINDLLRGRGRCFIRIPTFRVCPCQVDDHASLTVDTAGFGIRILRIPGNTVHGHLVIIIPAVQIPLGGIGPDTFFFLFQEYFFQCGCIAACLVESDRYLLSRRRPKPETSSLHTAKCPQGHFRMIGFFKFRTVKPCFACLCFHRISLAFCSFQKQYKPSQANIPALFMYRGMNFMPRDESYSSQSARHRTKQALPAIVSVKNPAVRPVSSALITLVATIPTASSTTLTSTVPKIPVSTVCSAAHKHTPACLRTRAVVKTKTPSAAIAIPNATIKATGVTVTVPVICRNAASTPTRILATTDSTAQRLRQLQPKNDIFFTSHSNICLPALFCAVVQQWVKLRFLQCRNDRMQFSKAACRVIIEKKRKECPIWNNSSSLCGSV